jgi:DNA mismatch repair protein MutL
MPDIIQLLPDSIANQIAAGEVVQRPASAVKELIENAIDAEATSVRLIVKESGKTLLQVIDNGKGMSETDARMSLERHATSKIRKAEDLFELRTMGFRGEALASIAAVSQMEMKTRLTGEELGTLLVVEGSEVKRQEPVACDTGTSIAVKNLFYNIPGRRNFLKSNANEYQHIVDEFQRLALSHPDVAFQLIEGDSVEFDLAPAKLSQRIVGIFGKPYQEQLAPCKEETALVKLSGYLGKPQAARKKRGEQFLFVNKRFIRSNYLHHAVMTAFEGLLPESTYPFYVLFIEIDPKHIDVNVHPTKTEIKFDDERAIYAVVLSAVRQAIGTHNLTPTIDFDADVNLISKLSAGGEASREVYFEERFSSGINRSDVENWDKIFSANTEERFPRPISEIPRVHTIRFESALNQGSDIQQEKLCFQLHNRYIVKQVRSGLLFIDQQAAHERILFQKFLKESRKQATQSQQCLFPQTLNFNAADFAMILEMRQEIEVLGFRIEVFGKNTLLVTGIPGNIPANRERDLFEGLIEQFKINQAELSVPLRENLARALAKRAAIKSGQVLLADEMKSLVDSLFTCTTPNYAPDGRPTYFIFELSKIESYFR